MSEEGSRRPSALLLYSALTLMVLFWSMNFVVARYALREFPPLLAASIRAVLAGGRPVTEVGRELKAES